MGTDFSRVEGSGSLGVMIVAEASGEMEARDQLPLRPYAPAGSLLERTFRRMGYSRAQFSLTNCLRCRPARNWLSGAPWEWSALTHCRPNLDAVIRERRPRAILTLGDTALRELTGEAGEQRGVSHLCGYVLPGPDQIPVIPAFHPAFIRRGKAAYQGFFSRNLHRAIQVAAGKDREWIWGIDPERKETYGQLRYSLHPGLDEARSYAQRIKGNQALTISYDIETYESASLDEDARDGFTDTRIRLIQFSDGAGSGIAMPWEGAYRDIAGEIIREPHAKCGHNLWLFDNKVLEACGLREGLDLTPRGTIHDTLQMFHHWQPDLPAHLQFCAQFVQFPFPWKHLAATNLEFYGCVDVDATLRLYTFLRGALEKDGIWDSPYDANGDCVGGYVGQVEQVRPILAGMERRGLPVDDAERLKLDGEFDLAQQELDAELQKRVPEEVLGLEPRRGKKGNYDYGYIKTPKDTDGLVLRTFTVAAVDESTGEPCQRSVERYCRRVPFNANSGPQLLRYMDAKKHKRPKSKETDDEGNEKDTTSKKELTRLAHRTGDDFYLKVIEYRELTKMRGTYIEGFKPHADGRVHTTFTFDTGIGQLSCCAPWTGVMTEYGPCPISQIELGMMVWTHARRWRKVTALWKYDPEPMVDVHFSNGTVLTCLPDHKLLIWGHEYLQELDQRERGRSAEDVSKQGSTYGRLHFSEVGHLDTYSDLDPIPQNVLGGVCSIEKAALFKVEDGNQEPVFRQAWFRNAELDRDCRRWVRVSDLLSRRSSSIRASVGDGSGSGHPGEGVAEVDGSTPHRRGYEEQSHRQFGPSDQRWAQSVALPAADGSGLITIEKIIPVGRFPVHDITVEDDASYAACNVFSHNSRNPNIQNFPKHGRLAHATRRMIAAEPGMILTEWDYKSCHVLTLGFLAKDANYIRCARIDMHSLATGHKVGVWDLPTLLATESDAELKARCRWLKSNPEWKHIRDARMKHAILGIGNGLKARGLYEKHMEDFSGVKEAQQFLDVVEELFPRVFEWHKTVQQRAHEQQFQRTQYGHIRRFYEVFRWDYKKAAYSHGDQAEEAISYHLSNIAFGYIREHAKLLERAGLNEKYGLCNNVHDSLVFHFPAVMVDEHVREVYPLLIRPSAVLSHPVICPQGLWIDAECNVGKNLAEMEEVSVRTKEATACPVG